MHGYERQQEPVLERSLQFRIEGIRDLKDPTDVQIRVSLIRPVSITRMTDARLSEFVESLYRSDKSKD